MKLSNEQYEVFENIKQFIQKDDDSSVFVLSGAAGTGKTTLVKTIIDWCAVNKLNVLLAAPTGRAAKILSQKTNTAASTIHSLLYNFEDNNELIEGKEDYKIYFSLKMGNTNPNSIYIIDESSLIADIAGKNEVLQFGSGKLLTDLITQINLKSQTLGTKIIFIGDSYQLPPVSQSFSPVFKGDYFQDTFNISNVRRASLKQVFRQEHKSAILELANKIRQKIDLESYNRVEIKNESDVKILDSNKFVNQFLEEKIYPFDDVTAQSIIIASKNKLVATYNHEIRQRLIENLYNEEKKESLRTPSDNFMPFAGEPLLVYKNTTAKEKREDGVVHLVRNGEFLKVIKVNPELEIKTVNLKEKEKTITVKLHFRTLIVSLRNQENEPLIFEVKVLEDFLYNDQPSLTRDMFRALYVEFVLRFTNNNPKLIAELKSLNEKRKAEKLSALRLEKVNEFEQAKKTDPYFNALLVKFGYALTAHKAQGGEWQNVFLDASYYQKIQSESYFRWLYTAITRAQNNLYVTGIENTKAEISIIAKLDNLKIVDIMPKPANAILEEAEESTENECICPYDMPEDKPYLLTVYQKMELSAGQIHASIVSLNHLQWAERYSIEANGSAVTLDVIYKGNGSVSSIRIIKGDKALGERIIEGFHQINIQKATKEVYRAILPQFSNDVMLVTQWPEIWETLANILEANEINLVGLEESQYQINLFLQKKTDLLQIRFYYKQNGIINSAMLMKASSLAFANDLTQLINQHYG